MDNSSSSILITGDLVINQDYDVSKLDPKLISLFSHSDLNIVNLEAPVTNSTLKIRKSGPHVKADEKSTLNILKTLGVNVVTLANNHVKDYDEKGVEDTLSFCSENNIQTVGAGMNLEEASKTLYLDTSEGKIAVFNFAENEWASATEETAGANPMNIIDNANQIKKAKQNADYVFVIAHGGHEYYNLPSPRMQKQYRFYAEQGADIVIGHHTHCISGYETHKGIPIYYSLGNFLFTKSSTYEDWYTGLVLELNIDEQKNIRTSLHPVSQQKSSYQLHLMEKEEKQNILSRIGQYNAIINDSDKLEDSWRNYVKVSSATYLKYWSPMTFIKNRYLRALINKLNIKTINKPGLTLYLNLMRCEIHADMTKEVLTDYLKQK